MCNTLSFIILLFLDQRDITVVLSVLNMSEKFASDYLSDAETNVMAGLMITAAIIGMINGARGAPLT